MTPARFIPTVSRPLAAAALLCALALSPAAHAGQILINPGDDWQTKAAKARPGDEIILMPGRHREALFDRLEGAPNAPITIRGASPTKPSIISAQLDGIRIKQGAHLIIKDLQIIGGSASGIWIGAAQEDPSASAPALARSRAARAREVQIDNVSISQVGPRGQRHGVFLWGFADVRIKSLSVEGWGGSAVELVACEDVLITHCVFRGLKEYTQYCGVRARAGCDRVSITGSRFEQAGEIAVSIGGKSATEDYVPPIAAKAANASVSEAARVTVDQCVIADSPRAIAFIHAEDCTVRNNTILRPRRSAFALLQQSPDLRVKPTGRNTFGNNLVSWKTGDLKRLVEIDDGANAADFVLEPNLWWSDEALEARRKLGQFPGKEPAPQIFDVDPKLDTAFKATAPYAQAYGAG